MESNTIFTALVGSRGCGLAHEKSDYDYKGIVFPTWDDISRMSERTFTLTKENESYTYYDIRKLPSLFNKSNPAILEMIYSPNITINMNKYYLPLFQMKDDFAKMNVPYLVKSCLGQFHQRYNKAFNKDKTDYVGKELMHAYKNLDLLSRLYYSDFNFVKSIQYDEKGRQLLFKFLYHDIDVVDAEAIVKSLFEFVSKKIVPELLNSFVVDVRAYEDCKEVVKILLTDYLTLECDGAII